ncbi:MAG: hypothetical protein ACPGJS_10730 [Flammeovirgaceae bacterium]
MANFTCNHWHVDNKQFEDAIQKAINGLNNSLKTERGGKLHPLGVKLILNNSSSSYIQACYYTGELTPDLRKIPLHYFPIGSWTWAYYSPRQLSVDFVKEMTLSQINTYDLYSALFSLTAFQYYEGNLISSFNSFFPNVHTRNGTLPYTKNDDKSVDIIEMDEGINNRTLNENTIFKAYKPWQFKILNNNFLWTVSAAPMLIYGAYSFDELISETAGYHYLNVPDVAAYGNWTYQACQVPSQEKLMKFLNDQFVYHLKPQERLCAQILAEGSGDNVYLIYPEYA